MNWINYIGCNDDMIKNIIFNGNSVIIIVRHWDGSEKKIEFSNYHAVKERNSIGVGIGEIFVKKESILFKEIQSDIVKGGGTINKLKDLKSFQFMDEWDEYIVLEIIAETAVMIN